MRKLMMKALFTQRKIALITTFIVSLLALTFYLCGTSKAEMYRWVDENGDTQITNSPPPKVKTSGEVKIYRDNPDESQSSEPASVVKKNKAKPSIGTKKKPEVILYGTSWCPYCRKARDFFSSRGIDFVEYDIDKDKEAAIRKKELDTRDGVPFAIINGRYVHGFSESAYDGALQE
jgi:glutaredoxin